MAMSNDVEILIVEDSPTQAAQLRYILEQHGYRVSFARNGVEALAAIQDHQPTIVISDIVMPEMDGYELCRRMKEDTAIADIPIILLTTLNDSRDVVKALENRADNFITKPCNEQFLLSRLQYILANQQIRKNPPADGSTEIFFSGQKYRFTSDPRQIIDLLLSTFDNAIQKNLELERANREQVKSQLELKKLNEQLEQRVKERTRKLAISEANHRRLLEHNADAIIVVDHDGVVHCVNPATEALLERPADALLNTPLAFPISIGKTSEVVIPRKNGEVVVAEMRGVETTWEGEPAVIASLRDITERKRAEEALQKAKDSAEAADQAKSDFLANMSHEIRTPMNGILGMIGLLLDSKLSPEQRDHAETVKSCAESLLGIINEILDFSKIEGGKLDLEIIDFDLHPAIEEVVEMFAKQAEDKKLELASLIYHDVPSALRGDPGRVRQVLNNIVGNAIKFTEHGEVVLRVMLISQTATHAMIKFAVSDTGIGIPGERMDRLFQTFSQVDTSSTRKYGGTGIGLAISKKLTELMGGEIGVESELGKGSTFWFTVPFEKQAHDTVPASAPRASLNGLRALIVDDNQTNRTILRHQLTSWGMKPHTAKDGLQALEMLTTAAEEDRAYDIAILDFQMPEMDGLTLAKEISGNPELATTRLVLLTSVGRRGDGERARDVGIDAYLTKPVRQSQLYECLRTVLGQPTRQQETPRLALVTRHTIAEAQHQVRPRILVAEDNPVNQKLVTRLLEKMEYRADVAANGLEAVDALARIPYAAVLMDCQMPEMDGFEATAEIRRRDRENETHTPVIAVTAHAMKGDRERCLAAGMDDYISKPVKADDLKATLNRFLRPIRETSTPAIPTRQPEVPPRRPPRTAEPVSAPAEVEVSPSAPVGVGILNQEKALTRPEESRRVPVDIARTPNSTSPDPRVLVAEDNPVNQKLIVRLLEKLGHKADVAANGVEAVEAMSRFNYNIVLMDCQMPEMDGFEATAEIRKRDLQDGIHTPIIAVTAHAMKGDRERCLAAGMDDYVSKPVRSEDLKAALDRWLRKNLPPQLEGPARPATPLAPLSLKEAFNMQEALARVDGDRELLGEMAALFLEEYPRFLAQIQEAVSKKDSSALSYAAHTLKGSVGNFAANAAFDAAFTLERIGRQGDLTQAPTALVQLEDTLTQLMPALTKLTAELAA
jgi:CheY-like chemotaxis protein/HPt (histidine-containing phosphotransfer) domain-containing protein